MTSTTRRTFVKGAAWAIPVIAAAVAIPESSASPAASAPISCVLLNGTGSPYYVVTYADFSTKTLHRREVVKDEELKALCRVPANGNQG